jgi:hypothetical protein
MLAVVAGRQGRRRMSTSARILPDDFHSESEVMLEAQLPGLFPVESDLLYCTLSWQGVEGTVSWRGVEGTERVSDQSDKSMMYSPIRCECGMYIDFWCAIACMIPS